MPLSSKERKKEREGHALAASAKKGEEGRKNSFIFSDRGGGKKEKTWRICQQQVGKGGTCHRYLSGRGKKRAPYISACTKGGQRKKEGGGPFLFLQARGKEKKGHPGKRLWKTFAKIVGKKQKGRGKGGDTASLCK